MKLRNRIFKNSFFTILDQILNLSMNFLLSILFARYLGAESLGQYSLGLAIIGLLAIFTNFGIVTIMNREIAKSFNKTNLYLGNALGIKFFISFPLLILWTLIIIKIFNYKQETTYIILLIAIYNTFISSTNYINSALTSLHRSDIVLKINILNKLLSVGLVFILLDCGFKLVELLYIFIIVSIISFLFAYFQIKKIIPTFKIEFNKRFNKVYILLSFPLILASAAEFINLRIDTIFIGNMLGEKEVGYYSASYNIFLGASFIPLALTKVYFPNFIDLYKKNKNRAFILLKKYSIYYFLYSLFVGIIFWIFSDKIIKIIYGNKFIVSGEILQYLSVALIFIILNRLFNYTLLALKQNHYYFKITLIGMVMNLILNYFLIIKIGVLGAVIATIITELVIMSLGYYKLFNIIGKYENQN